MAAIVLNGITWGHSRGITPLLAVSQRYSELHPDIEIHWHKRSLQEFADYPIEKLTREYDLLVIDHPWVGRAAATRCVLPLEQYLSTEYLADQEINSVGNSHLSYQYDNHQWALAIDAATPAASYRKDLLERNSIRPPVEWGELIELAKTGRVAVPAIPIDLLMNFYTICIACGQEPFQHNTILVDDATGIFVIETMKQLYGLIDKEMFGYNPIAVAERMTSTNDYWYCPFAYCYTNYSRTGYAPHLLHYQDTVSLNGKRLRTTIGGTGLAVSAFCKNKEIAVDFAAIVASAECQRTMYVQHGGQPAHRAAWVNEETNGYTNDFFRSLLPVMENGYMRPRYNGYLYFQDLAGEPLHRCLLEDGDPAKAIREMNEIYQQSILKEQSIIAI